MTLSALIQKSGLQDFANANSANSANEARGEPGSLARLATLALATPGSEKLEVSKPVPLDLTLAAAGLPITAEQFRFFLSQDDLADIAAGLIPVECLRAYAERFSKRLPVAVDDDRVWCAGCAHFERLDRPH